MQLLVVSRQRLELLLHSPFSFGIAIGASLGVGVFPTHSQCPFAIIIPYPSEHMQHILALAVKHSLPRTYAYVCSHTHLN